MKRLLISLLLLSVVVVEAKTPKLKLPKCKTGQTAEYVVYDKPTERGKVALIFRQLRCAKGHWIDDKYYVRGVRKSAK